MSQDLVIFSIVIVLIFAGCSTTQEMIKNEFTGHPAAIEYSVIYYIHADAGYLYHDPDGEPVRGNSRVLDVALNVAEKARSGEVFVFYQRPEKKFLGLFPQNKSRFYHFTNGQKSTQVKYRHTDSAEPFLTTEAHLYRQYGNHTLKKALQHYFLYYGHKIPNEEGTNYHRTLPDIKVNTVSFSEGIQRFLMTDDQIFDLVVLSTCNNGTPAMAELLTPITKLLLASPQNLHLSHIDSDSMASLERDPRPSPVQLAHSISEQTYRRLTANIQTAITLSLYDLDLVSPYISELHRSTAAHEELTQPHSFQDNTDCAQFPFFDAENYRQGVESWYKPARFGRGGEFETHSGWGCKPLSTDERISEGVLNK